MSAKRKKLLVSLYRYFTVFLAAAFIISCCMMLFVTVMANVMELTLTADDISVAAKLTFLNVVLLTLVFIAIDSVWRKFSVDRHVKRISDATRRITQGDFSARITLSGGLGGTDGFDEIAESINKMARELSSIETLRTDFIANVSHELKTPLSVIGNCATMLSDPTLTDGERREYAETATAATRNLSSLISNILKLNKLENQQIYPTFTVYDLGEQLCECLLSFEGAWEKKHIEIEADIADGVLVCSDAELMTLVWNNLFSNAIKFTGEGGHVGVTLSSDGECATVTVSDTGCGISREVGEHIFEKFYQGDTSHATQGNGLGLTLVKRVIDITGCDIEVSSEVGRGSAFTVRMRAQTHEKA